MPCNTVRISTINLAKVDHDLLKAALEALGLKVQSSPLGWAITDRYGYGGTFRFESGKLTHNDRMRTSQGKALSENLVKQAYSGQVVQQTARKFGWSVRETGDNQYTMVRR